MRGTRLSSSVLFVCLSVFCPHEAIGQIGSRTGTVLRSKAVSEKEKNESSPFIATAMVRSRYLFQLEYLRIDRRSDMLYLELHAPEGVVVDNWDPMLQLKFGRAGRWFLEAEKYNYWMPRSLRPKRYARQGYPPKPRILMLDLNSLDSQAVEIENLEVVATIHQGGRGLGYQEISFVFSKSFALERSGLSVASK